MNNRLINTKMLEFKKRNQSSHQRLSFDPQDKENILPNHQRFQELKQKPKNYLVQAQKLIMNERMKDIVADNVQYFRNILQANDVPRPNKLTLKLPGKYVPSSYRTEFRKKQHYLSQTTSVDFKRDQIHNRSQNFSQSKLPLTTTYQNEFKKFQEVKSLDQTKAKVSQMLTRSFTSNAPSFLDTHNMLQYRNWGNTSLMPSMKPNPQAATVDIPFKASSMYRTQFHTLILPKTQMVIQEESYPQSVDLWMGKSSYEKDFNKKVTRCHDQNYKPKQASGATNLPFKSTTEYKQIFLQSVSLSSSQIKRHKRQQQKAKKLSNMEIEKLVMDL